MKQVCGIWLPDSDEHLAAEIAREENPLVEGRGTYQLNKYRAALKHVKSRRHAVDVGANVGLWSRVMALDFEHLTAIEPVASHRACFVRNVQVEGVRLLPYAVGAKTGEIRILVPAAHVASAYVAEGGEAVEAVRMDALGLGPIDLLKMDIEGYEYEALLGGEKTIRSAKPVMVVEQKPGQAERYGRGQWDAVGLLKAWGMSKAEVIGGDHIMVWAC